MCQVLSTLPAANSVAWDETISTNRRWPTKYNVHLLAQLRKRRLYFDKTQLDSCWDFLNSRYHWILIFSSVLGFQIGPARTELIAIHPSLAISVQLVVNNISQPWIRAVTSSYFIDKLTFHLCKLSEKDNILFKMSDNWRSNMEANLKCLPPKNTVPSNEPLFLKIYLSVITCFHLKYLTKESSSSLKSCPIYWKYAINTDDGQNMWR